MDDEEGKKNDGEASRRSTRPRKSKQYYYDEFDGTNQPKNPNAGVSNDREPSIDKKRKASGMIKNTQSPSMELEDLSTPFVFKKPMSIPPDRSAVKKRKSREHPISTGIDVNGNDASPGIVPSLPSSQESALPSWSQDSLNSIGAFPNSQTGPPREALGSPISSRSRSVMSSSVGEDAIDGKTKKRGRKPAEKSTTIDAQRAKCREKEFKSRCLKGLSAEETEARLVEWRKKDEKKQLEKRRMSSSMENLSDTGSDIRVRPDRSQSVSSAISNGTDDMMIVSDDIGSFSTGLEGMNVKGRRSRVSNSPCSVVSLRRSDRSCSTSSVNRTAQSDNSMNLDKKKKKTKKKLAPKKNKLQRNELTSSQESLPSLSSQSTASFAEKREALRKKLISDVEERRAKRANVTPSTHLSNLLNASLSLGDDTSQKDNSSQDEERSIRYVVDVPGSADEQHHRSRFQTRRYRMDRIRQRNLSLNNEGNDDSDDDAEDDDPLRQQPINDYLFDNGDNDTEGNLLMNVSLPGTASGGDVVVLDRERLQQVISHRDELPTTRRKNLTTPLSKLKTRVMLEQEKDFTNPENLVPPRLDLGEPVVCQFCDAISYTLNCCMDGDVKIPPPLSHPNYLKKLITGTSPVAEHFCEELVSYNSAFALGSISYCREMGSAGHSFIKVNGMLHYQVAGSAVPKGKSVPLFHQLYKYDVNEATKYRLMNPVTGNTVLPNVVRNITHLLEEKNCLVKQYKTSLDIFEDMIGQNKPMRNVFVVLRSPAEVGYKGIHHPGTLSRPKQEMESILYTVDDDGAPPKHGLFIVHRQSGGRLEQLSYWNALVDPISYPLLFPYGNAGFRSQEFKKHTDYVCGRTFEDEFDPDEFPYASLRDEMDTNVPPIKYIRARNKYKRILIEEGQVVSDFELDEDELALTCPTEHLLEEMNGDGNDELMVAIDVDLSPEGIEPCSRTQEESLDSNLPSLPEESSDTHSPISPGTASQEESSDTHSPILPGTASQEDLPDIDNHIVPGMRYAGMLQGATAPNSGDDNLDGQFLFDFEYRDHTDQDPIDQVGEVQEPQSDVREVRNVNWKEREDISRREAFEQEKLIAIRNKKIRDIKAVCLKSRYKNGNELMARLFPDYQEYRRVCIDLDFLERKQIKHRDYLYFLAELFFGMSRFRVRCCFPHDDEEMSQLQAEVDYELTIITNDPTYRSRDKHINDFRKVHLMYANREDQMETQEEEVGDLVQYGIGEDYLQELEDLKNRMRGVNSAKKKKRAPVKAAPGPRTFVSRRQHALHQMQMRQEGYHPILSCRLLGQLYTIDLALRILRQRHDNARDHMIKLRGSHENTLTFQIHDRSAKKEGFTLGYAFQITDSMPGSVSWYKRQFENSMATIDYTGKLDLFITMTGNPAWREIQDNLIPGTDWQSNTFLVNDVFRLKMQELLNDIVQNELFGPVLAWCYSIEFQKRGMPHMHLLITLKPGHKLDTSAKVDKYISAKIPEIPADDDPQKELKLRHRENVKKHMLHTSCINNPNAYCRVGSPPGSARCTKMFPVPYNTHTSTIDGGKVDYHRPKDDSVRVPMQLNRQDALVDNQYVVPYCPFLLNKYECHINVESVTTVDVVKYIYKYIFKGFDKCLAQFIETFQVDNGNPTGSAPRTVVHASSNDGTGVVAPRGLKGTQKQWCDMNDRIAQELHKHGIEAKEGERLTAYDEAIMVETFRQMTASEAAWIIQSYPLASQSHIVTQLSVHEEGKMPVFFRAGEEEVMEAKVMDGSYQSQLVAWFKLNERNEDDCRKYTYDQIPLHYIFEKTSDYREWIPMSPNHSDSIKRVVRVRPVSPRFLEAFAIRLLAMNRRGPTSFEDLRTIDGITFDSAHDAAKALGLMDSQVEFENCLNEAKQYQFPNRLRRLFTHMLLYCQIQDPRRLWDLFEKDFQDRRMQSNPAKATAAALFHISYMLAQHNATLEDFKLPGMDVRRLSQEEMDLAIDDAISTQPVDHVAKAAELVASLNPEQRRHFDTILKAVETNGSLPDGNCFFLQGSGGCGKTYLYRALYYHLHTKHIPVAMIATTGIAATLLIKGTTCHRKFMLPLDCQSGSASLMQTQSKPAKELAKISVFIIDESTMASKHMFEAIDRLFKDITGKKDLPFGGKVMLLGGDWKQLLPVVPGHSSLEATFHSLKQSSLWKYFTVLTLTKNMRAQRDPEYSTLLENIGNGLVNGIPNQDVFPKPECIARSSDEVVDFVYGGMAEDPRSVSQSCILASLNSETAEINEKVLSMLPGYAKTYRAIDFPNDMIGMQVCPEYFEDSTPSGMAPFNLTLKKGAIVILLRNLLVSNGLCNGSRLMIREMYDSFVEVELLTTDHAGTVFWISPLMLQAAGSGKDRPKFQRFQFPFRLAYALTINKSQGQTFDRVGVILNNNVFAHGQLYVAMSRVRQSDNIRIFSAASKTVGNRTVVVLKNKVERSILEEFDEDSLHDPHYELPGMVDAPEPLPSAPTSRRNRFTHNHQESRKRQLLLSDKRRISMRKQNKNS